MPERIHLSLLMICVLTGIGCTEIVEEDLDGSAVLLLTPPAGYSSTSNQVEFRWESVPHTTDHRLQVATPDFISPVQYRLDSAIEGTVFVKTFAPGAYQWRVRGENSNSHTDWYARDFTIISTEDLSGQVPVLLSPPDGAILGSSSVTFDWDTLPFTDDHRFVLYEDGLTGTLVQDLITAADQVTIDPIDDGQYTWGVQAQNDVPSVSDFSYRSLTVDATPPGAPVQLLPADGSTLPDGTFSFAWQSGTDALTSVSDSLVVKDALLQTIRSIGGLSGTYADSLGTGTYTWSVFTIDGAGNSASAGPISFTVP
jgi:hypothetical protein